MRSGCRLIMMMHIILDKIFAFYCFGLIEYPLWSAVGQPSLFDLNFIISIELVWWFLDNLGGGVWSYIVIVGHYLLLVVPGLSPWTSRNDLPVLILAFEETYLLIVFAVCLVFTYINRGNLLFVSNLILKLSNAFHVVFYSLLQIIVLFQILLIELI